MAPGAADGEAARLYRAVVDDVVARMRNVFVNMGVDEQVLVDLQMAWERRILDAGVFHPTDWPPSALPGVGIARAPSAPSLGAGAQPAPVVLPPPFVPGAGNLARPPPFRGPPQYDGPASDAEAGAAQENAAGYLYLSGDSCESSACGRSRVLADVIGVPALSPDGDLCESSECGRSCAAPDASGAQTLYPARDLCESSACGKLRVAPDATGVPTLVLRPGDAATFDLLQVDGASDGGEPADVKPSARPSDDDDELGSDLDSDTDDALAAGGVDQATQDLVLCQYEKVHRVKTRWRGTLRAGIVSLGGARVARSHDYVFGRAQTDFDW